MLCSLFAFFIQNAALMAYQVAFDLSENQNQPFLIRIVNALPTPAPAAIKAAPAADAMDVSASAGPSEAVAAYNDRLKKLIDILSGETTSDLFLQFLYTHNKTDLQIITSIKVCQAST
jgi:26S proteasome regulatory subunit N2